mmetsp:Transcript_47910/g.35121  ORF Transcript_47910/g.35121 Transcript_47910/m.35121 type:complete len:214 (+) Transcript_47910:110-751(+)
MGIPLTKRDAREKFASGMKFVVTEDVLQRYDLAKLKVYDRRAQLGLTAHPLHRPFVEQKNNPSPIINLNQVDETLDGVTGFMLGFAYGYQYSQTSSGECYDACDTAILLLDSLGQFLKTFYNITNLGYFMEDLTTLVDVISGVYAQCELQFALKYVASLISVEGVSSLGANFAGSIIFTLPKEFQNFQVAPTSFSKGEALAKIFVALTALEID